MDSKEEKITQIEYIFVDGSYYCFYRYYASLSWWRFAHPEIELGDPFLNADFVSHFRKLFVEGVKSMPKKLKASKNAVIIVGKDCKRENIWRHEFIEKYKGTRPSGTEPRNGQEVFYGGKFFNMVYEEELFVKGGAQLIIKHPKLEADDVIAISAKRLLNEQLNCKIFIITSDKDYLQLLEPRLSIVNAAYKNLGIVKGEPVDGLQELFIKTVIGDKSDNINAVFAKCGYKTALKCYKENDYFESKLIKENAHQKYLLNKKLIDFNEIPQELSLEFMSKYNDSLLFK